jgi:hypothetical protein
VFFGTIIRTVPSSSRFQFEVPDDDLPIGGKFFTDLPSAIQPVLKSGFEMLAKFPQQQYGDLAAAVITALAGHGVKTDSEPIANLGFAPEKAGHILSAAAMLFLSLRNRPEADAEKFVILAQEAGLIAEADQNTVAAFAKFMIRDKGALSKTISQSELGSEVLPSLVRVAFAIDVRFSFDKDDVVNLSVPVAVLHITTDSDTELWCQATQWELEQAIETLATAIRRIKIAATKYTAS